MESKNDMKKLLAQYDEALRENEAFHKELSEVNSGHVSSTVCIRCKGTFFPSVNNEVSLN